MTRLVRALIFDSKVTLVSGHTVSSLTTVRLIDIIVNFTHLSAYAHAFVVKMGYNDGIG